MFRGDTIRRVLALTGLALVLSNMRAGAIDGASTTNKLLGSAVQRTISVAPNPQSIAIDAHTGKVFVTSLGIISFSGLVTVLDSASGKVVRTVTVGVAPRALAVDQVTGRAFVVNAGGTSAGAVSSVSVLDAASGAVLRSVSIGSDANAIAVDSASGRVFVTHLVDGHGVVSILNARDGTLLHTLSLAGAAQPITVAADGGHAVVLAGNNRAYVVNARSGQVTATTQVGQGAAAVAIDTKSGRAFVANQLDNTVSIVSLATGAVLRTVAVGVAPSLVTVDGPDGLVLVVNEGDDTLSVLNAVSGDLLHTVSPGLHVTLAMVDARDHVVVLGDPYGKVRFLDLRHGSLSPLITPAPDMVGIGIDSRQGRVFVVSSDGTVHTPTGSALAGGSGAWPDTLSSRRSQAVIQAFIDAYNQHNLTGVLALFPDHFVYGDCDYAHHILHGIKSKAELATWLRARFADHDYFEQARVVMSGPQDFPPNDPHVAEVQNLRTSDTLRSLGKTIYSGFKIILTADGAQIGAAALSSNTNFCSASG